MNSKKAISLLNMQLEKLITLDNDTYQAWKTQTSSYTKDIFGHDSEEYSFIKNFDFIGLYDETPNNYQIKQKTPRIKIYLENCIESIENRGLIKRKDKNLKDIESWTKRYPIIWEILKALIILTVGYLFRYIIEPK